MRGKMKACSRFTYMGALIFFLPLSPTVGAETFTVNLDAILQGRATDFILQPKDLVYVPTHPWSKVEEILEIATRSFVQSAAATWTGANVGPWIK